MEDSNLKDRIEILEGLVAELHNYIKFHKLDKIPLKYRKAFPQSGENPLFQHDAFKPNMPIVQRISHFGYDTHPIELQEPTDPKEYDKAKLRMKEYEEKSMPSWNANIEYRKKMSKLKTSEDSSVSSSKPAPDQPNQSASSPSDS